MTISEAYADLGGGVRTAQTPAIRQTDTRGTHSARTPARCGGDSPPPGVCAMHMFDPVSGWCGCGTRDDGKLAEGSPAWRAELERRMPSTEGAQ